MTSKSLPQDFNESGLFEQLFSVHFDGVLLIDTERGEFVEVNELITGKLSHFINPDAPSYLETIKHAIANYITPTSRLDFSKSIDLGNIVKNLETHESYFKDFQFRWSPESPILYKRLNFRYLNSDRNYIIMSCEDISTILENDIDPLTGILDSTGFHKRVSEWINVHPGRRFRIHRYYVDHFKDINGVYGYEIADKLLRDIGTYMHAFDTENSFSAHFNAEHFIRFCSEDSMSVHDCYDKFVEKFSDYGLSIPIKFHVGVYDLCEEGDTVFRMCYKALLALQTVKQDLNCPYAYYEKGMMERERGKLELLLEVDRAMVCDEFEVYFQPQVDYLDKSVFSAEALIRWRHPKKGLVSPGRFIPHLERSNFISKVDLYVIKKTCAYLRKWINELHRDDIHVSVNLSRRDVLNPEFLVSLEKVLQEYGLKYSALHLEITESAYTNDSDTLISIVDSLRAKGFFIELDDFGSGYSSLNTLKDINVDKLKIDMKFLSGNHSKKEETIIEYVIQMSHSLGLPVIAEGVETIEQAKMLLEFGCRQQQGYFFAKPIPAQEYEDLIYGKTKLEHLA